MNLIRYLFRKAMLPGYLVIAMIFALIFSLAADRSAVFRQMLPVVFALLLSIRTADDIFDYETDQAHKTQYLTKSGLIALFSVIAVSYVLLNILLYQWLGWISAAAICYIFLQEKYPLLKPVYMPLLFLYYFYVNAVNWCGVHFAVIAGCLIVSAAYSVYKRKVRT